MEDSNAHAPHVSTTLQVMDTLLFHEYTVVDRLICRVSAWLPPETNPSEIGRYQGLVKLRTGEQVIREFYWDGAAWKDLRLDRTARSKFYWRGLASDPALD